MSNQLRISGKAEKPQDSMKRWNYKELFTLGSYVYEPLCTACHTACVVQSCVSLFGKQWQPIVANTAIMNCCAVSEKLLAIAIVRVVIHTRVQCYAREACWSSHQRSLVCGWVTGSLCDLHILPQWQRPPTNVINHVIPRTSPVMGKTQFNPRKMDTATNVDRKLLHFEIIHLEGIPKDVGKHSTKPWWLSLKG